MMEEILFFKSWSDESPHCALCVDCLIISMKVLWEDCYHHGCRTYNISVSCLKLVLAGVKMISWRREDFTQRRHFFSLQTSWSISRLYHFKLKSRHKWNPTKLQVVMNKAAHRWICFFRLTNGLNKKKTDLIPIHTLEVDGGILPTELFHSDGRETVPPSEYIDQRSRL